LPAWAEGIAGGLAEIEHFGGRGHEIQCSEERSAAGFQLSARARA